MIVLGVDTATSKADAAVLSNGNSVGRASTDGKRSHSETLLTMINLALEEAGITLKNVSLFAVGLGPGAFTALRVGVTTMKALSYSLSIPLVGVSTLKILAAATRYNGVVLPVLDARKGEVFTAPFEVDAEGNINRLGDYGSLKPDELLKLNDAHGGRCLLLGSGVPIIQEKTHQKIEIAKRELWNVDALTLCRLALKTYEREGAPNPGKIRPLYVRKSDAEINLEKRKDFHGPSENLG